MNIIMRIAYSEHIWIDIWSN